MRLSKGRFAVSCFYCNKVNVITMGTSFHYSNAMYKCGACSGQVLVTLTQKAMPDLEQGHSQVGVIADGE